MNSSVKIFLALSLLLAGGQASAQAKAYCCTDSTGHRICGDVLPQSCYDKAYKEIAPSGRIVREISAPLTDAERKKREGDILVQRQQERAATDARRHDAVLLETYSSVSEIDVRRESDIRQINADVQRSKAREAELVSERNALEKTRPAKGISSNEFDASMRSNTDELAFVRNFIRSKINELDALKLRYDRDRQRFIELKQPSSGQQP